MEVFVGRPKKLYRYSERQWLERTLRFGEFRLRPASAYKELEPAPARQDDERNRVSISKKGTFKITLEQTGAEIETLGDLTRTSSFDRDYYTLCFSSRWDPGSLEAFEGSDSCLVVHDPEQVMERVHSEVERLFPGWVSLDAPVTYGTRPNPLGVPFSKPEQYVFQAEHRLVVIPPEPQVLVPVNVVIGSIEDVAEIVDRTYAPAI
ncbi:hypothetical protein ACHZ97_00675 [Lysobacter soli]|uniref:hypothetical protein n=1 Tax=Lysobacter soli TaxID=453783 RepID=UPI0037CC699F